MADMQRKFSSPFKFCPVCGNGQFVFSALHNKETCTGCGISAFKAVSRYYGFYCKFNREEYLDHNVGDI